MLWDQSPSAGTQGPASRALHTQFLPGEGQEGGVLVEVLVEVDAQHAQLLLDSFDFLQKAEN